MISHYRIDSVIGTGTFATVYRARDMTLDRDDALKLFKGTDAEHAKAALNEARAAASLNHPNVCTIFAVDDDAGDRSRNRGRLPLELLRPGEGVAPARDEEAGQAKLWEVLRTQALGATRGMERVADEDQGRHVEALG